VLGIGLVRSEMTHIVISRQPHSILFGGDGLDTQPPSHSTVGRASEVRLVEIGVVEHVAVGRPEIAGFARRNLGVWVWK